MSRRQQVRWSRGLAAVLLCSALSGQAQQLQFAREEITIRVLGESCTLEGSYVFRNLDTVALERRLFYPIPVDRGLPFPDSVVVTDVVAKRKTPFVCDARGVYFSVALGARGTACWRVSYNQRTPGHRFEYILTTTRAWGRPLEEALFRIVVPDTLVVTSLSIPADTVDHGPTGTTYSIHKRYYLPDKNLVVSWRRRKP